MKNLKRIMTECYDTNYYYENEPYGVQEVPLMNGELFVADGYEWILLNNFGVDILTDFGYYPDDDYLSDYPEKTLEMIEYLIKDASEKGWVEDPTPEEKKEIAELLGDEIED